MNPEDWEPEQEPDQPGEVVAWLTLRHRDRVARQQRENMRAFLTAPIACAAVLVLFMAFWSVRTDHTVTRVCHTQPAACHIGGRP